MKNSLFTIACILSFWMAFSCLEEIPLDTKVEFDEAIVIEATITNELKSQVIKLSRSYRLEEDGPNPVSNASVIVRNDLGNTFVFEETQAGTYNSVEVFSAQPNTKYTLEVSENGTIYTSSQESFLQPTQIDQLYLERDFNENQEEGISIYLDTFDPTGNSNYYRYAYEETYKIIAPKYSSLKLNVLNDDFPIPEDQFNSIQEIQDHLVELVPRDQQLQVCYNTVKSNTVIIIDTNNFQEDQLEKYRIRFISRDNYIMSHRYSILVKQYVQSSEAFNFYETLKAFSLSESVFSESQTGFFEGNIDSNISSKKVIGFFQVSPVDSKRVYFNYADQFTNEDLPPYFIYCGGRRYPLLYKTDHLTGDIVESDLQDLIKDKFQYYTENPGDIPEFSGPLYPFYMVIEPCGDCTALGTTEIPDFWEE
jgi:hypothetical protein